MNADVEAARAIGDALATAPSIGKLRKARLRIERAGVSHVCGELHDVGGKAGLRLLVVRLRDNTAVVVDGEGVRFLDAGGSADEACDAERFIGLLPAQLVRSPLLVMPQSIRAIAQVMNLARRAIS